MTTLTLTVKDLGIGAALQSMTAQLRDMTPINKAIGARLERNINMRFDTKTDPSGKAWAPWSKDTADERKAEGRGNLLEYTGRMRDSLTYFADNSGVEIGFGVDYAKYHEQLTQGSASLPKRAMLFHNGQLSESDLNDALFVAMRSFKKQLKLESTP